MPKTQPYTRLLPGMRVYSEIENMMGKVINVLPECNEIRRAIIKLDDGQVVSHREMVFHEIVADQLRLGAIKKFTLGGHWSIDCTLGYIETTLENFEKEQGLNLEPDYQRSHV